MAGVTTRGVWVYALVVGRKEGVNECDAVWRWCWTQRRRVAVARRWLDLGVAPFPQLQLLPK